MALWPTVPEQRGEELHAVPGGMLPPRGAMKLARKPPTGACKPCPGACKFSLSDTRRLTAAASRWVPARLGGNSLQRCCRPAGVASLRPSTCCWPTGTQEQAGRNAPGREAFSPAVPLLHPNKAQPPGSWQRRHLPGPAPGLVSRRTKWIGS